MCVYVCMSVRSGRETEHTDRDDFLVYERRLHFSHRRRSNHFFWFYRVVCNDGFIHATRAKDEVNSHLDASIFIILF